MAIIYNESFVSHVVTHVVVGQSGGYRGGFSTWCTPIKIEATQGQVTLCSENFPKSTSLRLSACCFLVLRFTATQRVTKQRRWINCWHWYFSLHVSQLALRTCNRHRSWIVCKTMRSLAAFSSRWSALSTRRLDRATSRSSMVWLLYETYRVSFHTFILDLHYWVVFGRLHG